MSTGAEQHGPARRRTATFKQSLPRTPSPDRLALAAIRSASAAWLQLLLQLQLRLPPNFNSSSSSCSISGPSSGSSSGSGWDGDATGAARSLNEVPPGGYHPIGAPPPPPPPPTVGRCVDLRTPSADRPPAQSVARSTLGKLRPSSRPSEACSSSWCRLGERMVPARSELGRDSGTLEESYV